MPHYILGPDDPESIVSKPDKRNSFFDMCDLELPTAAFDAALFNGIFHDYHSNEKRIVSGSYSKCIRIDHEIYDIDMVVAINADIQQSTPHRYEHITPDLLFVILMTCKSHGERDAGTRIWSGGVDNWLAHRNSSSLYYACTDHHCHSKLFPFSSSDTLWYPTPSKRNTFNNDVIKVEETNLEGIDGYVVADGVTACIVIKQSLTNAQKAEVVHYLLVQSAHGQKVGVYMWCLEKDHSATSEVVERYPVIDHLTHANNRSDDTAESPDRAHR